MHVMLSALCRDLAISVSFTAASSGLSSAFNREIASSFRTTSQSPSVARIRYFKSLLTSCS
uniref:Uncharacterized protein n=1 Tax=Arundo donax TaxID=35708 RepID=A0A0A9EJ62_ARUDO